MKSFIAVVTLFVVLVASANGQEADMAKAKATIEGLANQCKGTTDGATDEDVKNLISDVAPTTQPQKCLLACVQEQLGVTSANAFYPDGFLAFAKLEGRTDEASQKIAADCKDVKHDDRCELAVLVVNCMMESSKVNGVTSGSF